MFSFKIDLKKIDLRHVFFQNLTSKDIEIVNTILYRLGVYLMIGQKVCIGIINFVSFIDIQVRVLAKNLSARPWKCPNGHQNGHFCIALVCI